MASTPPARLKRDAPSGIRTADFYLCEISAYSLNAAATLKGWANQRKHEKERNIVQLAQGHLLSHKQNKLPVLFIGLAQQTAELAQIPRIFA